MKELVVQQISGIGRVVRGAVAAVALLAPALLTAAPATAAGQTTPRPGVHLVFGSGPTGSDWTVVPVPATGGERTRVVPLTVVNTSPGPMTVEALTLDGAQIPASACAGALSLPAGAHVSCSVQADVPSGTAGTSRPFRAYVRGTSTGIRIEDEALGRWSFTTPAPPDAARVRVRDSAAWVDAAWPSVVVDEVRLDRSAPTWALFQVPEGCIAALPETLGDLVATAPTATSSCTTDWRLTRAATAALLNEATLGDAFPARDAPDVTARTNAALTSANPTVMDDLTVEFERWNHGER